MKYVVIQTGGKQYRVSEGDVITVERLDSKKDEKISFSEVLLQNSDGEIKIGAPFLSDVTVTGIVTDHVLGDKIRVAKYKAKSRYRRVMGHRQKLSMVKIQPFGPVKEEKKVEKAEIMSKKPAKPAQNAK